MIFFKNPSENGLVYLLVCCVSGCQRQQVISTTLGCHLMVLQLSSSDVDCNTLSTQFNKHVNCHSFKQFPVLFCV